MTDVEQTGRIADSIVLSDDTRILDGHAPTRKWNNASAKPPVDFEKRSVSGIHRQNRTFAPTSLEAERRCCNVAKTEKSDQFSILNSR
jgi:hypothetical protein